jgi:hypothetical protein
MSIIPVTRKVEAGGSLKFIARPYLRNKKPRSWLKW